MISSLERAFVRVTLCLSTNLFSSLYCSTVISPAAVPIMTMDQHTPPVDDNLGPAALAICTPILALALLLYVVRVVSHMHPKIKLGYADYIVSLAVVRNCIFSHAWEHI